MKRIAFIYGPGVGSGAERLMESIDRDRQIPGSVGFGAPGSIIVNYGDSDTGEYKKDDK